MVVLNLNHSELIVPSLKEWLFTAKRAHPHPVCSGAGPGRHGWRGDEQPVLGVLPHAPGGALPEGHTQNHFRRTQKVSNILPYLPVNQSIHAHPVCTGAGPGRHGEQGDEQPVLGVLPHALGGALPEGYVHLCYTQEVSNTLPYLPVNQSIHTVARILHPSTRWCAAYKRAGLNMTNLSSVDKNRLVCKQVVISEQWLSFLNGGAERHMVN